jgi:hypothetical protein
MMKKIQKIPSYIFTIFLEISYVFQLTSIIVVFSTHQESFSFVFDANLVVKTTFFCEFSANELHVFSKFSAILTSRTLHELYTIFLNAMDVESMGGILF